MGVPPDKRTLLARHILFRGLAPAVLDDVVAMSVTKNLQDAQVLFLKGDTGGGLYGVLGGKVKLTVGSTTGREIILGVMREGDIFGEIALLDGGPRTANAVAMGPTMLLMVPHREFSTYLQRNANLCCYLLKILCDRLRSTNERVENAVFLGLADRLARRLLDLARHHGREAPDGGGVTLNLSQQALGQMLGTSRESVNKQLQAWRKRGWIDLGRSRVVIRDPDALGRVAHGDPPA
jgi:CRP/FNR family transcriptional regulator, cyclic AMP receptor protein